jgi:hypothetical protein
MFALMSAVRCKFPTVNVRGSLVLHSCCSHQQDRRHFSPESKHKER